jgi:hypothetical protein
MSSYKNKQALFAPRIRKNTKLKSLRQTLLKYLIKMQIFYFKSKNERLRCLENYYFNKIKKNTKKIVDKFGSTKYVVVYLYEIFRKQIRII